jgi:hypothetical protein
MGFVGHFPKDFGMTDMALPKHALIIAASCLNIPVAQNRVFGDVFRLEGSHKRPSLR